MPGLFRRPPAPQQRLRRAATFPVAVSVDAGLASGTGEAFNVTTDIKTNAGLASGTGLANQAAANVRPNAGLASGTGLANNAAALVKSAPNVATGTGTANQPSASVAPFARAVGDWHVRGRATMGSTDFALYNIQLRDQDGAPGGATSVNAFIQWVAGVGTLSVGWSNGPLFDGDILGTVTPLSGAQNQEWTIDFEVSGEPLNLYWRARAYPTAGPVGAWVTGTSGTANVPRVDDIFRQAANGAAETSFESWGSAGGWGDAFNAVGLASKTVAAGLASGSGQAFGPSTSVGAHPSAAFGSTSFPTGSPSLTDTFNRTDETPIGSPWDTSGFSPSDANLVSNKFQAPASSGGGALWDTSLGSDFETFIELATDLESDENVAISLRSITPDWIIEVDFNLLGSGVEFWGAGFDAVDDFRVFTSLSHTPVTGDALGFRRAGQTIEGWFKPISGAWTLLGAFTHADFSGGMFLGVEGFSPDRDIYLDNFTLSTSVGTASANIQPNAGLASGTGSAFNPGISTIDAADAGVATGTGAANQPSANVAPNAGLASGTGTAYDATVSAAAVTNAAAGLASGTGQAFNATTTILSNPGVASGTGTAFGAAAAIATSAGGAAGSGTAGGPAPSIATGAGSAAGTGQAYDATVSTATATNAAAGLASGGGDAFGASISIKATAGNAAGAGTAFNPVSSVSPNAGAATGTGTAFNPTATSSGGTTNAAAGLASGVGTAYNATVLAVSPSDGGGAGHRPRTRGPMRAGRRVLVPVEITINAVVPAPEVAAVLEVNDDEVVLELLAGIL